MKTNYLTKIVGGLILGLSLVGITVMSSTTTQAQYPWSQNQAQRQRELERQRERELRSQREEQARQGGWDDQYGVCHPSNQNNGYYNNNNGYYNNGRRGRNNDGYPNLGGSFDLRQTALNAGFADGGKAGRDDR